VRTVAGERRVRVAVDEPGDCSKATTVDLRHVAVELRQVAHPADVLDAPLVNDDVGVLDNLDPAEHLAAERRGTAGRRRELREVTNEQPAHGVLTT